MKYAELFVQSRDYMMDTTGRCHCTGCVPVHTYLLTRSCPTPPPPPSGYLMDCCIQKSPLISLQIWVETDYISSIFKTEISGTKKTGYPWVPGQDTTQDQDPGHPLGISAFDFYYLCIRNVPRFKC